MRSLLFLTREALINLRRHGLMTVAAVTTIAVTLTLLGTFAMTFFQVQTAMRRAAGEFEIRVFCRQSVGKQELPVIRRRISALPGVATVSFVSKEQAFRDYTKDLPIDTAGIPNQFNDTFVVTLSNPRRQTDVAAAIRGWHAEVEEVSSPEAEMAGVLRVMDFLRTVGTAGAAVLLFGALVVVSNTIRVSVFARRREIRIMQIVGATAGFIRLPLFLEGMIHGLAGGAVAAATLFAIDRSVHSLIAEVIPMLARYFTHVDMPVSAAAVLAGGAIIGAGGSLVAIRRYLKVV